jgi:hypothetical protein
VIAIDAALGRDGDGLRWFDSRELSHGDRGARLGFLIQSRTPSPRSNARVPVDSRGYWM